MTTTPNQPPVPPVAATAPEGSQGAAPSASGAAEGARDEALRAAERDLMAARQALQAAEQRLAEARAAAAGEGSPNVGAMPGQSQSPAGTDGGPASFAVDVGQPTAGAQAEYSGSAPGPQATAQGTYAQPGPAPAQGPYAQQASGQAQTAYAQPASGPTQGAYQQPPVQPHYAAPLSSRDHVAAGLLAMFLGGFGVHKFYLGYNTQGFIMLALSLVGGLFTFGLVAGVVWIIAIIEGIVYLTKTQSEFEQLYVYGRHEWF